MAIDQQKSEEMLVREAIDGEEEAFIQLYYQNVEKLYLFLFRKVSNKTDAEDLVSETFYQALKNIKKFSFKSSFKNWLFGIAKHLLLAYYREKYQKGTVELDDVMAQTIAEPDLPEETPQDKQKVTFTQKILDKLSENYRKVIELRFLKGYTVAETAKAMKISEENAKVVQHRALKKANELARDLEEYETYAQEPAKKL